MYALRTYFSKSAQKIGEVTGERDAEDPSKALVNVMHNTATNDDSAISVESCWYFFILKLKTGKPKKEKKY